MPSMTGRSSGGVASAGAKRAKSPHMRPNSRLPPSPSRALSARLSSRAQSAPLSYRAHSAKVQWEAAHGEPCPYAYACPRVPSKRKRQRGPAAPTHNNTELGGVLPTGVPGARSQYYGFGRGFYKNPNTSSTQHTSNIEREARGEYRSTRGADPASAATGATGAKWRKEDTASSRGGRVNFKVNVKPGRRRRAVPTLLEIHQRVIDAALLEISRPREGPFENLGERLGGEHETFTYCPQDGDGDGGGDGGGEGTNMDSTACASARLPETMKPRTPTATGKRRARTRTRDAPRPSTGPRQVDLPRCNEPWKIPLLRTSWTPSNNSSRSTIGDPFGDVEYDLLGSGSGSGKEGPTSADAGSPEYAAQSSTAAGALIPSDDVKEQSADKALRPRAESAASLLTESLSASRIAASQYVEEMVSTALLRPLLVAAEEVVDNNGIKEQATAESDALSWDGVSEVGGPALLTAAKHYVEETVSKALRGAFLVVSGKANLSTEAAEKVQRDCTRSREQVIASESRIVAHECVGKYLQRGLQARQAAVSGEASSGSQIHIDTATVYTGPPVKIDRHLKENLSPVLAQPDAFGKHCHTSGGESGATTPSSGFTSRMSSDSSSIEFVLNDDSSAGTQLGDGTEIDHRGGTGLGSTSSSARAEAVALAATAAVGEGVSSVVSKSALETTQQSPAGVKLSPSALVSDQVEFIPYAGNPEGGPNNRHPGAPLDGRVKTLPLGFLKDIVERRASLKPVVASRPTSASVEHDGRLEVESRKQRERCAQQEAEERASALRELEVLARAEGLDRYDPGAFSRGVLYGEGRHSVVYSAHAERRPCGNGEEKDRQDDTRDAASTAAEVTRRAAAATMARETIVEVLTMAMAAGVATEAASASVSTMPTVVSTALIESVVRAAMSAVVATTKTVLAAKEFRYAGADVPVSVLRKAHREVSMHLRVSGCAQVVALRGVWLTPRVTLLLEPMGGGNLHRFVRHRTAGGKARNDETTGGCGELDKRRPCTSAETAWLVAEAADGLAALHDAGVVHRDVKSHNVMVVERRQGLSESTTFMPGWEAKLGDLGSATLVPPKGRGALTEETGTSGWMAPEVFGDQGYGTPADVYSLGVLIWDAFVRGARDNPLCGLAGEAGKLRDGLRPPWPRPPLASVAPDIERLAERCWVSEPGGRPTAGAVANELRSFADSVATDLAEARLGLTGAH